MAPTTVPDPCRTLGVTEVECEALQWLATFGPSGVTDLAWVTHTSDTEVAALMGQLASRRLVLLVRATPLQWALSARGCHAMAAA